MRRLAQLEADEDPAWLDAPIARSPPVRARARQQRSHRPRIRLGQDGLGCAPSRGDTGALTRRQAGGQAQALRRGRRHEAVEGGHLRGLEGIQGSPDGGIVQWLGSHAGRHEAGGGRVLEEARHEGECVVHTSQAIAPHRFDRLMWKRAFEHGPHAEMSP
jgi:hypothetical protein